MSPDRKNTLDFIDWTIKVFRQEWMDAPQDQKKAAFEKINRALEMRVEVMKLVNYDAELNSNLKKTDTGKPSGTKKNQPEPPTINGQ